MKITRHCWTPAAHGAAWFHLGRHDDPEPDPAPQTPETDPDAGEPQEPEEEPDPEGAEQLGDAGKKALERMKAEKAAAKKEAAAERRKAAEALRRVQEFEDRDKGDLERATDRATRAEERATRATERAVKAEVKAMAAQTFADPTDAELLGDLTRYVDAEGQIDAEQIGVDLTDLLERKPHLRKPTVAPADPDKPRGPRPDPGQGSRKDPGPTDYRTADRTAVDAKLAEYGVKLRR
ncbi:hypothetical protein JJV70_01980 [Streptomyces sp. JJ66]|uniref:hypothetical protein n=1 Tax=Streptomyces sp. JJ66 TaxID=2803843 RepID=UPI001C561D73|nr:hypothetical protein [Streptomyces sp. JJ66]MBW1600889.1 hypothetical protein [Streptomyces sp. JJ66]